MEKSKKLVMIKTMKMKAEALIKKKIMKKK
jgi:hypothetical protein